MTNKGLCSFARILTGGLDKFDKTNRGMMRTIKELLPKVIADQNDISRKKLKHCSLLLKDPTNFRGDVTVHFTASESYCAAAFKVLEGLENFSFRTLTAMLRKLNGVKGYIPPLRPPTYSLKAALIKKVRKKCTEMLSNIGRGDEPSEELAGALGVASLTLKLLMNCPAVRDFRRFSPEIVALQYKIAKAIHLLDDSRKVSSTELKEVQLLLDPNIELPARSLLRKAIQNLLIEYLLECSDMDNVPDFFLEALDIIHRRAQLRSRKKGSSKVILSSKELMKEEIEKEMQQLLNISAQAKEVVANLLPEHDFDEEFARAYMEDFDGSDTHCVSYDDFQMVDDSQHFKFHSYSSYDQTESIGEIDPVEFSSPVSTSKRNSCLPLSPNGRSDMALKSRHLCSPAYEDSKLQISQCMGKEYPSGCKAEKFGDAFPDSVKVTTKPSMPFLSHSPARKSIHNELKSEETTSYTPATEKSGFSAIKVEETDNVDEQSRLVNGYLELQEACDTTSMVAYRFVGYMLDTLAKTEGLKLCQGDRSYLHSHASVPEDIEGNLYIMLL